MLSEGNSYSNGNSFGKRDPESPDTREPWYVRLLGSNQDRGDM